MSSPGTTTSIMVVDDDPITLRLLTHHLIDSSYAVITASSGAEAIERLAECTPAMVIADWSVSGAGGEDLCRYVRAADDLGEVYTIALGLEGDRERLTKALGTEIDDYLTKPFHQRELLARVRAGLRIVELERGLARTNDMISRTNEALAEANAALERMAETDDLTGLPNRRSAMATCEEQWRSAVSDNRTMACVRLDIDAFRHINDHYGNDVGDRVLRAIARTLRENTRGTEEVFRIGGEEFLVLCPRATAAMATRAAERMRTAIESLEVDAGDERIELTASIGVAERSPEMRNEDHLLRAADEALDDAKQAGRNCVRVAPTAPHAMPAREKGEGRGRASA